MKKSEVPQDDEGLMEGKLKDLCYALDENGKYVQVYSTGWKPKNAAMKQAWQEVNERADKILEEVIHGTISPIAYYMEKNIMDIKILAKYLNISKRKVRKHMKPENFKELDQEMLNNYARTFNISVEELCHPKELKRE